MEARCAVVGLGRIGSLLERDTLREKPCTHTGAIVADEECRLVAGCDIDPDRRKQYRTDWGIDAVYDDAEAMIRDHHPEILVVATHPDSHLSLCRLAATEGVPIVVCEKPLADTLGRARKIAALHLRGGTKIITNHERRYSADYNRVRRAVVEELYGRLLSVRGTLYFGRTTRRDQMLLHDGTHIVDAFNYLTGERTRLRRRYGALRSRRGGTLFVGVAGPIDVALEVGSERDHLVFEIELSFEKGRIRVGNGVESWERSEESPYYEGYRSLVADPPVDSLGSGKKTGYFANMIRDAVVCLREPEREPVSSALDALEVMKFIKRW